MTLTIEASSRVSYEEMLHETGPVYFADRKSPLRVSVRAMVFRELPLVIDFGHVRRNYSYEQTFLARGCDGNPLPIINVDVSNDMVDAETLTPTSENALPFRITLRPGQHSGAFVGKVLVEVEGQPRRTEAVTIRAYVERPLEVRPAAISLGRVNSGATASAVLEIVSTYGSRFVICDASAGLPGLKVKWHPVSDECTSYLLTVSYEASGPGRALADVLEITTDHPDASRLAVPVYGLVSPES